MRTLIKVNRSDRGMQAAEHGPAQDRTATGRKRLAGSRQPAQAMVLAGFAMAALLAFVALVLNFGLVVVERRHLQTTADAAAMAATMLVLDQQVPGRCQDLAVSTEVDRAVTSNGTLLAAQSYAATYIDRNGSLLSSVGSGSFSSSAIGVQVVLSVQFDTLLAGIFEHIDQMQARAQAQAGLRSPDSLVGPLPIAMPRSIVATHLGCAGAAYNLYSGVLLDLLSVAPPAGSVAQVYGDGHTNLQYWSDGSHDSGTLAIGSTLNPATVGDISDLQTGLGDNATREGLPDYVMARIPLCDDTTPGTCSTPVTITGFTQAYIQRSEIGQPNAPAYFVPYFARLTL